MTRERPRPSFRTLARRNYICHSGPDGLTGAKLEVVTVDVTLLRAGLKKVTEKVTTTETDIARLQPTSKRLEEQVRFLTTEHEKMEAHLEDQEGRARRNNVIVVEVPEGAEGPSVELFLETQTKDSLRPKRLSKFFTDERAHRAPVPSPKLRAPPRTIIARIFNFRDKDAILQASRFHGDLQYEKAMSGLIIACTVFIMKGTRYKKEQARNIVEKIMSPERNAHLRNVTRAPIRHY
ncbi:hypothetical protein NDU88_001666 [Pleurodeles waltl]|uniref:Transposase n=1 Tax=Pleurodeles waltl TaxID=8319 RepID=A0AAV7R7V8_PLEWA|nr:hypothetical protein NDU88_001666 [Pleurodeles waltl]